MHTASLARLFFLVPLLLANVGFAQAPRGGSCLADPPPSIDLAAGEQLFLRLATVDNTLVVRVNSVSVTVLDERPPKTTIANPIDVPLTAYLQRGKNTLTLDGYNERCVTPQHCKQNPWEFHYTLQVGSSPGSSRPVADVVCKGNEANSASDTHVMTHSLTIHWNDSARERPGPAAASRAPGGALATESRDTAAGAEASKKRFRAVVVIATQYAGGGLRPLPTLAKARAPIERALRALAARGEFSPKQTDIVVHTDAPQNGSDLPATDSAVVQSLYNAARASAPGDVLVYYFTGHGSLNREGHSYLFTTGANANVPANRLDVQQQVIELMEQNGKASVKVAFIDACQVPMPAMGPGDPLMKTEPKPGRVSVLYAASAGERAWIDERIGYGFFTAAVTTALASNVSTANELIDRIAEPVQRSVADVLNERQRPYLQALLDGASSSLLPNARRPAAAVIESPRASALTLRFQLPKESDTRIPKEYWRPGDAPPGLSRQLQEIFIDEAVRQGMKVEWLPSGAVVPTSLLLEAVAKGTLDGGALIGATPPQEDGITPIRCGANAWLIWGTRRLDAVSPDARVRMYALCGSK